MNPNEYQKLAQVTESPVNDEMRSRIKIAYPHLVDRFRQIMTLADEMDAIKRYLFYGKMPTELARKVVVEQMKDDVGYYQVADFAIRLLHSGIGIFTEVGEYLDAIMDLVHVDDDSPEYEKIMLNLREELGDFNWYNALGCNAIAVDLGQVMESNINKLEARYGDKFDAFRSVNRDLGKEMEALQSPNMTGDTITVSCERCGQDFQTSNVKDIWCSGCLKEMEERTPTPEK